MLLPDPLALTNATEVPRRIDEADLVETLCDPGYAKVTSRNSICSGVSASVFASRPIGDSRLFVQKFFYAMFTALVAEIKVGEYEAR